MEKINGITIPFYKFKGPDHLVTDILQDLQTKKFASEPNMDHGSVYDDYFHEELFQFFENSINQVKNIYFQKNIEFPIIDCWVNKYGTMQKLRRHNHSNAVICGCYYLTTHENYGSTIWDIDNPWTQNNQGHNIVISNENEKFLSGEIYPEAGMLILFPATLPHFMKTINKFKTTRYTIAFNTFPSGTLSTHPSNKLVLNTQSVRDKVKLGLIK